MHASAVTLVSLVIPAYREEKNISYLYQELLHVISTIPQNYVFEIIFINDGSLDGTWESIEALCAIDTQVKGVNLSRNFGKEIAITAWLEVAQWQVTITLDADGQHPVEKIPDFLQKWEEGYDIVYNRRPNIRGISWVKKATSVVFYWFFNAISEFKLEPGTTDYRLLDRVVVDAYLRFREKNRMYRGLIDWLGFKKIALVFDAKERIHWDASYNYKKLLWLAINNLTSFSFFPLKFVGYLGFVITTLSSCILVFQLLDKIGILQLNFSNIGIVVVINTIMIGVVLMSLGLIGLYIANIHEEVIWRPLYVVKDTINF
jgi:polyisoprenyl-phosphate glycosyltransferase